MATITKRDLVKIVSEKTNFSQRNVYDTIEGFIGEVTESLAKGDAIVLRNFGTFYIGLNKQKVGRNPMQPEVDIVIPARKVVRFKAGKNLKENIEVPEH